MHFYEVLVVDDLITVFSEVDQIVVKTFHAFVSQFNDNRRNRGCVCGQRQVVVVRFLIGAHHVSLAFRVTFTPSCPHVCFRILAHRLLRRQPHRTIQAFNKKASLKSKNESSKTIKEGKKRTFRYVPVNQTFEKRTP